MNAGEAAARWERRNALEKKAIEEREKTLSLPHIESRDYFRRNGVGGMEYEGQDLYFHGEHVRDLPEQGLEERFVSPARWRELGEAKTLAEAKRALAGLPSAHQV